MLWRCEEDNIFSRRILDEEYQSLDENDLDGPLGGGWLYKGWKASFVRCGEEVPPWW